jgi:hypothetical protein
MPTFQFIFLICTGFLAVIAISFKLIGELMKKNESGKIIKVPCEKKFEGIASCIEKMEAGALQRRDRILTLELKFAEIISRIAKLENSVDKNAEMTRMIYDHMSKRKTNGSKDHCAD